MIIPIDIACPKCGSPPGEKCLDPKQGFKTFHLMSYSFHMERVFEARKQSEAQIGKPQT